MSEEAQEVEVSETETETVEENQELDVADEQPEVEVADSTAVDENASIRAEMEELRRRTEAAEANSAAVQSVYTQQLSHQEQQDQRAREQAAIDGMTPEERVQYAGELEKRELRQIAANTQAQLEDSKDQNDYAMMALDNPVAREHAAEVEKRLSEAHANGYTNVRRRTILKDLLGEKVLEGAMNGNTKQTNNAAESQKKSVSKPTVNSGDSSSEQTLSDVDTAREERNERLANRQTAYR